MGSPWKALSYDNRRQIMLLLKSMEMIPTQVAEHLNFTLPAVSTSFRISKEADLITEIKKGQNRFYSLNRKMIPELVRFFDDMYDYNYNFDYKVSFTPEEVSKKEVIYNFTTQDPHSPEREGVSVFYKDPAGRVFHTYSAYARGIDMLNVAYHYLNIVPKRRRWS